LAEGSEFELPVPVSKPSDDSIKLEFAAARRIALVAWPRIALGKAFGARIVGYCLDATVSNCL
jgi:hypothetical protein